MKMDYSGFTNAASIRAQAMSELGQQVGSFITKFDKDQQIKKEKADFQSAILPELMDMAKGDEEKAKRYAKMLANNPDAFKAVMEYKGIEEQQKKADMTQKVLDAVGSGTLSAKEAISMGVSPEAIKDYTGATEGQTAKQFTDSVTLAAEAVGGTYDPAQKGIVVDDTPYMFGGERLIPLSDPMFESYFADAKGQTMTGRGFDVLGTTNGDATRSEGSGKDEVNAAVNPVTSSVLQNVAPSNPEGSRAGRFMRSIGGALDTGAQNMIEIGESAMASVPASAEYLFGEGDLSYSDAQQKYEDPIKQQRIKRENKTNKQSGYNQYFY
tara:strand:- start:89 stop:1063 length:975 start_codon:yes stop_codon:yes gene_type:complete